MEHSSRKVGLGLAAVATGLFVFGWLVVAGGGPQALHQPWVDFTSAVTGSPSQAGPPSMDTASPTGPTETQAGWEPVVDEPRHRSDRHSKDDHRDHDDDDDDHHERDDHDD